MKKTLLGVAVALVAALFIGCENPDNGITYSYKKPTLPESVGENPFVGKTWDETTRGGKLRFSFVSNDKVQYFSLNNKNEVVYESILSYTYDTEKSEIYLCYDKYRNYTFNQLVNLILSFSKKDLFEDEVDEVTDENIEAYLNEGIDCEALDVSKDASLNEKITAYRKYLIQEKNAPVFEKLGEATYSIDGNSLSIRFTEYLITMDNFIGSLVTSD